MAQSRNHDWEVANELASELEQRLEFEDESTGELEDESTGEFEDESVGEFEDESTGEFEDEAQAAMAGTLQAEFEAEDEAGMAGEFEDELELVSPGASQGELEADRFVGRYLKRFSPVLKGVARVAAPVVGRAVGTMVGGPLGTFLGGQLGNLAARALREGEMELEDEFETAAEMETAPMTAGQAEAEFMAAVASRAVTGAEAEAMAGAATLATLSPRDRRMLRRQIPQLVRGVTQLVHELRKRRSTRPAIRVVPAVVRRTANALVRRAASGRPITARAAGHVMAVQTRRVLGNPRTCGAVLRRNIRGARIVARARTARRRVV